MTSKIAAQVQQTPTINLFSRGILQRQCASCGQHNIGGGECEGCQTQPMVLQRRAAVNSQEVSTVPPIVHDVLNSPGEPLDRDTRTLMEPRFGHDFSSVRVHTNSKAAASAESINAQAYTFGRNIIFGTGQYQPQNSSGQQLLAHELTHVVQQSHLQTNSPQAIQRQVITASETREERLRRQAQTTLEVFTQVVINADRLGYPGIRLTIRHDGEELIPGFAFQGEAQPRPAGMTYRLQSTLEGELRPIFEMILLSGRSQWQINYVRNPQGYMELQGTQATALASPPPVVQAPPTPPVPAAPANQACFDMTRINVSKNGIAHSCLAFTSADAPIPNGTFCIRRQGEAQRAGGIMGRIFQTRSRWYLLEPQFSTTRSRMHLHPGSRSSGCVTVTDQNCFGGLESVLNSSGTVSGSGYDGYPPGNAEGVTNPQKSVDCVAMLTVTSATGSCPTATP
jgi:hypothetical protein